MQVAQEKTGPKIIKTTVAVLQQQGGYFDTLFNVANQVFHPKVSYAIGKNINYCQSVFNAFNKRKEAYLKQYAIWEANEKGVLRPKSEKKEVNGQEVETAVFKDADNEIEYKKNMDRLFGQDLFNLTVHQVDDKYMEEGQAFAPAILQVLQPMFYSTTSEADPNPTSETPTPDAQLPIGEPRVPPQQENTVPVEGLRIEGDDDQRDGDPVLHGADNGSGRG